MGERYRWSYSSSIYWQLLTLEGLWGPRSHSAIRFYRIKRLSRDNSKHKLNDPDCDVYVYVLTNITEQDKVASVQF